MGSTRGRPSNALRQFDRAHAEYARRFYGADLRDSSLYHLMLDSTAIELDACTELIAAAARALTGSPVARS